MATLKEDALVVAGIGLAVLGLAWYAKYKITGAVSAVGGAVAAAGETLWDAAKTAAPYVNPADSGNVINRGVSGVGGFIMGDPTWTLGGAIYDGTHGGAIDITSNNNLAARTVNGIGGFIAGEENWTLGGAIYDWTH